MQPGSISKRRCSPHPPNINRQTSNIKPPPPTPPQDLFNIVAVDDFNMGAMENKSLNVFNSRLVLATPESSSDGDYARIEGVVAHEYFHNWTGGFDDGLVRLWLVVGWWLVGEGWLGFVRGWSVGSKARFLLTSN
jgi:hypothetical protein